MKCVLFCLASVAKCRKRDISSASERDFRDFFLNFFVASYLSKKRCFRTHQLTCSLSTCVATAPHRALWRVCKHKVTCVLDHWRVDAFHIRTFKGDSMFALLRRGHANGPLGGCQQNFSSTNERRASLERFRLITSKFRDEASCEMWGDEFTLQAGFLYTAGKNVCAAGKTWFEWILRCRQDFFWMNPDE